MVFYPGFDNVAQRDHSIMEFSDTVASDNEDFLYSKMSGNTEDLLLYDCSTHTVSRLT